MKIKYTSLHVEMHEFIFNRDVYDVVIEKVVGYHSLMRYSWPKRCGVCVEEDYVLTHPHPTFCS